MIFYTRKIIKYEDLNASGSLFGGRLMQWIDEEASIYAMCQLQVQRIVTKTISEINFIIPSRLSDVIEIGLETTAIGTTSITLKCLVRNKFTKKTIVTIEKLVFVHVDENGKSKPHHITANTIDK